MDYRPEVDTILYLQFADQIADFADERRIDWTVHSQVPGEISGLYILPRFVPVQDWQKLYLYIVLEDERLGLIFSWPKTLLDLCFSIEQWDNGRMRGAWYHSDQQ